MLSDEDSFELSPEEKSLRAEIKLTAMLASRNLAFLLTDFSTPLMKQVFEDSSIAKNMSLNRHRAAQIIREVLGPAHKERLKEILKKKVFSVIIDESTDISCESKMVVVVRYEDPDLKKICESVWDLILIYESEYDLANAGQLFFKLIRSFTDQDIPVNHIISFLADSCSVMFGSSHSLSTRLNDLLQNILLIKCNCHLEHLCARDAVNADAFDSIKLIHEIHNYFSSSSKRNLVIGLRCKKVQT